MESKLNIKKFLPKLSTQMLWVSIILFLVVASFTYREVRDRQAEIANQMLSRGELLMEIFDGSVRTGFRSRSGVLLQPLLEELANTQDIKFICIAMLDGTIIAHSNANRIGEAILYNNREVRPDEILALNAGAEVQAAELNFEDLNVFVVYRTLAIVNNSLPSSAILFIGQDNTPVLASRKQSYINAGLMGSLVFLFAIAMQYALMRSQKEKEAKKARHNAEKLAKEMFNEVKRLEKEMQRREKEIAIGDLAAGVAHELRNPLSSIKGYATYFAQKFPVDSADRKSAQILVKEVERLNRSISDLIDVAKPTNVHLTKVDLAGLISDLLNLISKDLEQSKIQVEFNYPKKFQYVLLDVDRIKQALLNILLNAVDAMEKSSQKILRIDIVRKEDGHYSLTISDTGSGLDESELKRIFDPYYTTKAQGTGLGLVITKKIIDAHSANLEVVSKKDYGTSIVISF